MSKKRFNAPTGGDEERNLLNGNRRVYPSVEINYLREEGWEHGSVYISISRDSEAMSIEQFEIFIAMFRKVIEIAQRKEEELNCNRAVSVLIDQMPHVEMSCHNKLEQSDNVFFTVSDYNGDFNTLVAERFAALMERLLQKGKEITKLVA